MQVNKDDFFLFETCKRMAEEGVGVIFFSIPLYSWDNNTTPDIQIAAIHDLGIRLKDQFGIRAMRDFNWSSYNEVLSRVERETRVRNVALRVIREQGYQHILVVDGDELWKRGTLAKVIEKVEQGSTCIATKMTNVIGLPGYPVEGGVQEAIIYYGGDRKIRECRHPEGTWDFIEGINLIHFTAVRKTNEEIIAKFRGSGHYDDPAYKMEEWIEKILPHIKPGMVNAHCWDDGHRWPLVRDFTKEELDQIPACYYPYLGMPQ